MSHLAIFALGPLRIELDGEPMQTSRHKALALLVYLAMNPGRHSRVALSALLWPEYSQEKAYAYLRRTLWEIRNRIGGDWLEADREEAGLRAEARFQLDVAEFQSHLAAFNRHPHPTTTICPDCIAHLRTAALLYRGDFMAGFSLRDSVNFDDWHFFQQEALQRDYGEALQKLGNWFYQEGLFSEAISFAQRWLALDSLNEEAHRLLMKIYVSSSQRHAALRQYQECQRSLETELGIDPEPATLRLHDAIASGKYDPADEVLPMEPGQVQKIFQAGSTADLLGEAMALKVNKKAHNLPTPATPFVGRQQECDQITALLADPDCWLLTLLGPGGIGKTRLAIEVGQNLADDFPQGVFFVSLSMFHNEQSISPAMASALGLVFRPDGPAPQEQLLDFLREKRLLMILDSFEGLVPWANFLAQIHSQATGIKLLVTSRRKLLLRGERVLDVNGLDYPENGKQKTEGNQSESLHAYSAVELFTQTARRIRVTFQPAPEDLNAIGQITRLLEGMPLGLELAATWIHTLPCPEIAQEISKGLDILESPLGDIAERQRSMRAVFNHSWNLLSNREQVLLPRLAVFRGGFSRQAARQIAGIGLQQVNGLANQSLVRPAAHGRFELHDLLRQYCLEKLERMPADNLETHRRHCTFYSTRLSQWHVALGGALQSQALDEMETEQGNLQAAWEWAVSHQQVDELEQAVDGLCMFFYRKARFSEGIHACQKSFEAISSLLPRQEAVGRLSSRLRTWQAVLCLNLERFDQASQFIQESQQILADPHLDLQATLQERIFLLVVRALIANLCFDGTAVLADYEQALQLALKFNGKYPRFLIYAWRFLMAGGAVTQELYLQMGKKLADVQQLGDPFELGCHLFTLGIGELYHAYHMEKAEALLKDSIKNFQRVEDPSTQVMAIKALGYLLSVQGNFEENLALKLRELEIVQVTGDRRMLGIVQTEIGEIYCHMGDYLRAEAHMRTGIAWLQDRSAFEVALRHRYLGDVLLAQGKYIEARQAYQFSYQFFQGTDQKGWILTALTGLSRAELALGNCRNARCHARQALQLFNEMQMFTFFAYLTVAEIALLLADLGQILPALELYGMVLTQGFLAQSRWFADLYGEILEEAACQMPRDAKLAAQTHGQGFDFPATTQWLLDEVTRGQPWEP